MRNKLLAGIFIASIVTSYANVLSFSGTIPPTPTVEIPQVPPWTVTPSPTATPTPFILRLTPVLPPTPTATATPTATPTRWRAIFPIAVRRAHVEPGA